MSVTALGRVLRVACAAALALVFTGGFSALFADTVDGFSAGRFVATNGFTLSYRLYAPPLEAGRRYPLLLHFHGAGSWGDDNTAQLGQARRLVRRDCPAFILAPKTVKPMKWVDLDWRKTAHRQPAQPSPALAAVHTLVLRLLAEHPEIDASRVYANGQSMGGYGTWDMITRYPELFAAAVPVCGGGDVSQMPRLRRMPIWVFHGARDTTVPVANSRELVEALRRAGNESVRYTEYPDVAHAAWEPAYRDEALFRWLFAQRKNASETAR